MKIFESYIKFMNSDKVQVENKANAG